MSKKIEKFQNESIRGKDVRTLGGIGEKHGEKLEKKGYRKAADVVKEFLRNGKSEKKFKEFLEKKVPGANRKHIRDCYESVRGWCKNHKDEKKKLQDKLYRAED